MLSKNRNKILISLKTRKGREKHGLFIVEGTKSVAEALDSELEVSEVYSISPDLLPAAAEKMIVITEKEMQEISSLSTPPGILAVVKIPEIREEEKQVELAKRQEFVLILDGIRDPGNLGTIVRTAEWFGHSMIIASEDTVEAFNPKVVQASMGSILRVKVLYADLTTLLPKLEIPLYGMDLDGRSLFDLGKFAGGFIIGSESHGIRPEVEALLTERVTIPGSGSAESLNAAISTAILLAEQYRLQ